MNLGYTKEKRERLIKQCQKHPKGDGTWPVRIAGKEQYLKIFIVSLDLPKYRIDNGRTLSAQEEYIADNNKRDDYFTKADFETNSIQKIQHCILKKKILKTDKVNIINEFRKEKQTQPLLLTCDGFVLNGNRRLCAMREVFYSDRVKQKHFTDIEVVALPFLEEKQLQEIEARLQLRTDWDQDYSWVDQVLIYKQQTQVGGLTPRDIAARDNIKVKVIDETIALLPIVNEYLLWLGKPKKYSLISDQEHSFRRLLQNWDKLKTIGEKDLLKAVAFQLIKNPHEGRTYTMIQDLQKEMAPLTKKLANELGKSADNLKELNAALKSKTKSIADQVIDTVIDVIETSKAKTKKVKRDDACIKAIKAANTSLEEAKIFKTEASKLGGLKEQIKQVESSLKEIKKW